MFGDPARWRRILDVNLWGVINGVQTFAPDMIGQGTAAAIVNTGSKQGITCPPGDTAYNVSKAGREGRDRGAGARIAQHRGLSGKRPSAHSGLRLHFYDHGLEDREAGRRVDARAGRRLHAAVDGDGAISTSSVPTTTCRASWTSAASFGRRATSSRTGRRSPAGIPTTRTLSPSSPRPEARSRPAGRSLADMSPDNVRGRRDCPK